MLQIAETTTVLCRKFLPYATRCQEQTKKTWYATSVALDIMLQIAETVHASPDNGFCHLQHDTKNNQKQINRMSPLRSEHHQSVPTNVSTTQNTHTTHETPPTTSQLTYNNKLSIKITTCTVTHVQRTNTTNDSKHGAWRRTRAVAPQHRHHRARNWQEGELQRRAHFLRGHMSAPKWWFCNCTAGLQKYIPSEAPPQTTTRSSSILPRLCF